MLCLVTATDTEAEVIRGHIRDLKEWSVGNVQFTRGWLAEKEVVLAISGPGKTNAAHATTIAIVELNPSGIINFGIAGALPLRGLRILDIALATAEIYADEGVLTERGFLGLRFMRLPFIVDNNLHLYNTIPTDGPLTKSIAEALKTGEIPFHRGAFLTVSTVTALSSRARTLRKRFRAICESMEGASVAHVCKKHRVDFAEIRCISNYTTFRDKRQWKLKEAARRIQLCIIEVLRNL